MILTVSRKVLEKEIEKTIRDAAGGYGGYGGSSQLYGRYDEDGNIYEFFVHTDMGNSFVSGERIVPLFTKEWFDPLDSEYLDEWFEIEKNDENSFIQKIEGIQEMSYEDFVHEYPNEYEKLYAEWQEIALREMLPDMINEAIKEIEKEIEILNNKKVY